MMGLQNSPYTGPGCSMIPFTKPSMLLSLVFTCQDTALSRCIAFPLKVKHTFAIEPLVDVRTKIVSLGLESVLNSRNRITEFFRCFNTKSMADLILKRKYRISCLDSIVLWVDGELS
jgi:hypothetical protein